MDIKHILAQKKLSLPLLERDIIELITAYSAGEVADFELAAFLMAVYFTGLSEEETVGLTLAMADGERLSIDAVTIDLQSTGGVGDKAALAAIPIAAAVCEKIAVPKLCRSCEISDAAKLKSISGFKTSLSAEEFIEAVKKCGCAISDMPISLAPTERRIAALRELTQTVDSIPLIAAGLVARELAAGVDAVVFDVKVGSGALTKTIGEARKLCRMLTETSTLVGIRASAVMTNMDKPLGRTIGGALELMEVIETLNGRRSNGDLFEVAIELGGEMLALGGGRTLADCRELAAGAIASGAALEKLREMIAVQGGNPDVTKDYTLFPKASRVCEVCAEVSGFVGNVDCEGCGKAAKILGADADCTAGIVLEKIIGDSVSVGERLATFYTSVGSDSDISAAKECFLSAYNIVQKPQKRLSPILR